MPGWIEGANLEDFRICDHEGAVPSHIKIALVKLPVAPTCHLWLVPAVDLGNVVPLDAGDAVEGHVAGKGHSEVVSQTQQLATYTISSDYRPAHVLKKL